MTVQFPDPSYEQKNCDIVEQAMVAYAQPNPENL